jgi:hypothetical protein
MMGEVKRRSKMQMQKSEKADAKLRNKFEESTTR